MRREAMQYINGIMHNWEILYDAYEDPEISNNIVARDYLVNEGFYFDLFTQVGKDTDTNEDIFRICEFGYTIDNKDYQIIKSEPTKP